MHKKLFILTAAIIVFLFGNLTALAATPAKKSTSSSTTTNYVNTNFSNLKFGKTSAGYISPAGHTYLSIENETLLELTFNNNNTVTIFYEDGGDRMKQTYRYTQSANKIPLSAVGQTVTISSDGRKMTSSDGIVFIVTE